VTPVGVHVREIHSAIFSYKLVNKYIIVCIKLLVTAKLSKSIDSCCTDHARSAYADTPSCIQTTVSTVRTA